MFYIKEACGNRAWRTDPTPPSKDRELGGLSTLDRMGPPHIDPRWPKEDCVRKFLELLGDFFFSGQYLNSTFFSKFALDTIITQS